MLEKPSYGWKDLVVDAAIVAVIVGAALLAVGSFPSIYKRLLLFFYK